MTAAAHFEITGGILRVYANGGAELRAGFDISVFVVGHDGVAILKGLRSDQKLSPRLAIAIGLKLAECGFTEAVWIRDRDGVTREIRTSLNRASHV